MLGFGHVHSLSRRRSPRAVPSTPLRGVVHDPLQFGAAMSIALIAFAAILLAAIGRLAWGAILVGREYDAEEQSWH